MSLFHFTCEMKLLRPHDFILDEMKNILGVADEPYRCLPNHPLRETISVPQGSRFYPCPSRRHSFRNDCKDQMFGNSVWHSCW